MRTSTGTVRPITLYGEPVLHAPCAPVTAFDAALATLIQDMFASMYAANGVGLAANQIGVGLRVFVYDCTDADDIRHVGHVVNPVLEPPSVFAGAVSEPEGCLSVPGPHAELSRPGLATVHGMNRRGAPISISGTGTFGRCLQHETDHLNGIVYVDLLSADERGSILAEAELGSAP